jgi:superfamily I DNA/RNA helicase
MHRVKGLEFQYIFIAGVNDGVIPLKRLLTEDPVEKRDYDFNERALLHVAATRAIKGLYVTASNQPSPYIESYIS